MPGTIIVGTLIGKLDVHASLATSAAASVAVVYSA
jgi:hypothetical protein